MILRYGYKSKQNDGGFEVRRHRYGKSEGISVFHLEAGFAEAFLHCGDVLLVAGLHFDVEFAAVDFGIGGVAFVLHGEDVGAEVADHATHLGKLTGLVGEDDGDGAVTAVFHEAAGDDAVERGDIDVAA